MKRTGLRSLLAATAIATGLSTAVVAPVADAQEATFQVTGEGIEGADLNDLFTVLDAVGRLADTIEVPEATGGESTGLQVILDPLEALASAISVVSSDDLAAVGLSDALGSANRMAPVRGQAADGRTVVFPTSGQFTSGYGARWGTTHEGIDIADPIGTPVLAVMDGEVINAGPARGFGQWVRLRHDDGSISVYGHVHTINVAVGQRVNVGDQIATIGNEGQSTGPHLHFEIRPDGNGPVDPVEWFARQGINVR